MNRASASERGFTLVEMLVALMILGLVLTAVGPAFYGALNAAAVTNQRSTATGLAAAATEQIRSVPYYQVAYPTTPPVNECPVGSGNPVTVAGVSTPIVPVSTQLIGPVTYTVTRCLYWVDSSTITATSSTTTFTQAYKQSVVTVTWKVGQGSFSVNQTSAIYPGGKDPYNNTPENNFPPGGSTTTLASGPPASPGCVTAADDSTSPTNTVDVSWIPPGTSGSACDPAATGTPVSYYVVQYQQCTTPCSSPLVGSYTSSPPVYTTTWSAPVAPGSSYSFQVVAVAADGTTTSQPSSPLASATTTTMSTTPASCQLSNLVVNPTSATVDSNGSLVGVTGSSFSVSVNGFGPCSNVTVGYSPTGSTKASAQVYAALTGTIPGTLTGAAGDPSTVWSTGNHQFTVYYPTGTQYSPLIQVQVDICQQGSTSC